MSNDNERVLRHELANSKQETLALKELVKRAADDLDELVAQDCSDAASAKATQTADRLRHAVR